MRKPLPFGKYLLLDRIAVGGMAEVFAAKTFGVEGFERILAIKRILPTMVEDDEFITMFIDEARIASQLGHSNLVQIYELGKSEDTYFIAMEYVAGRDVRLIIDKFRKRNQPVPVPLAVFIVAKMCEGLDHAHRKKDAQGQPLGIIHRDVSPQNVLVSYEGEVKIIDFGIAKAAGRLQKTQAGILKGKFSYMSPEQVRGLEIDHRSDLYSCGVMLYEMITGTRAFAGDSDFSTLELVRSGEVRAPRELNAEIPPALERIVLKALAKNRDERYQWCSEFHDDLVRFLYSGAEVYSTKSLSAFMKETFHAEVEKEEERQRRWHAATAEEASGHELEHDLPPARESSGPRSNPGSNPSAKIRLAPESAPPPEPPVPAEDRTSVFQAFGDAAPPQGDRTQMVTSAVNLEEMGLALAADEIDPDVLPPRSSSSAARPFESGSFRVPTPAQPVRRAPEPVKNEALDEADDGLFTAPESDQATMVRADALPAAPKPTPQRSASATPTPASAEPPLPQAVKSRSRRRVIAALALVVLLIGVAAGWRLKHPPMGQLVLGIEPESAQLMLDGQPLDRSDDPIPVAMGEHVLLASADGFESHSMPFTVAQAGPISLEITLEKKAPPPKAEADGKAEDKSASKPVEKSAEAPSEARAVEPVAAPTAVPPPAEPKSAVTSAKVSAPPPAPAKAATAPSASVKPAVVAKSPPPPPASKPAATATKVIAPPPAAKAGKPVAPAVPEPVQEPAVQAMGGLNIFSVPLGATLTVNGKPVGKTPQKLTGLPAGRAVELKLTMNGYKPLMLSQEVRPGPPETLRLKLEDEATDSSGGSAIGSDVLRALGGGVGAAGAARLTAMCIPTAQVFLDGRATGRWTPVPPTNAISVDAGRHTIFCETKDGLRSAPQEIEFEAGATKPYKANIP